MNNPEIRAKVASSKAICQSQSKIAESLGISQPIVSRIANLPETQKLIEEARNQILSKVLPKAVQNVQECVESALKPPELEDIRVWTDKQGFEHETETGLFKDKRYWGLKYSEKMMESIGIMGSNTPSTVIQNIFNQSTTLVNPIIDKLLAVIGEQGNNLPELKEEYE